MTKRAIAIIFAGALFFNLPVFSGDAVDDGTYDAQVTTESGTYSVPVEVEDGEVTQVHWSNGGNMTVDGAELEDGQASGVNSRGDNVKIEIDDSGYNSNPIDE